MKTLSIDAGQSGVRARLDVDGATLRSATGPGVISSKPALPQLTSIVAELAGDEPVEAVCAGVSGLDDSEDLEAWARELERWGVRRVIVAHDSITSYLGAIGDAEGAVAAVGTGAVILGAGPDRCHRVDGWGHLLGDAGSGYWIGRAGLDAVMRAHDGRGPATGLTQIVQERYPNLESMYLQIQQLPNRVATIASFARDVAALAQSDPVAAGITTAASEELARSIEAALTGVALGDSEAPAIGLVGKIFLSDALRSQVQAAVSAIHPAAAFQLATDAGLDGAAGLAQLHPGSALLSHVMEWSAAS